VRSFGIRSLTSSLSSGPHIFVLSFRAITVANVPHFFLARSKLVALLSKSKSL
jgi:hypothetical protein